MKMIDKEEVFEDFDPLIGVAHGARNPYSDQFHLDLFSKWFVLFFNFNFENFI